MEVIFINPLYFYFPFSDNLDVLLKTDFSITECLVKFTNLCSVVTGITRMCKKPDMVRTRRREQEVSAGYPDNSYQGQPDNRMVYQQQGYDPINVSEVFSNIVLIFF